MSVTINIEAENAVDAQAEMERLLAGMGRPQISPLPADTDAETRQQTTAPVEQPPEPPAEGYTTPDESAGGDESTRPVRGKNAEKLKAELLREIESGQKPDQAQIDRLPKKDKQEVEKALEHAIAGEAQPDETPATTEPEPPATEGGDAYTRDDLRAEIKRIYDEVGDAGLGRAREAFKQHGNGATKQSEIPDENITAVVAALKEITG